MFDRSRVRFLYPLLAFGAFCLFLAATAVSVLLHLVVPFALLAVVIALTMTLRLGALRLLGVTFRSFGHSFRHVKGLVSVVGGELFARERVIKDGNGKLRFPQLWEIASEVAAAMGTRMFDEVIVTDGPDFAVFESGGIFRGARRHLVLGLPYVYVLSLDEFRAVLAHEFGHFAHGHTVMARLTRRCVRALLPVKEALDETPLRVLSPLWWSTSISLFVLELVYLPWMRQQESDVDRASARAMGANHAISALRKVRDDLPALLVVRRTLIEPMASEAGAGPLHLVEASARLAKMLPAKDRMGLAKMFAEDPLSTDGTHPPIPQRLAALHGLATKPPRDPQLAAAFLPDVRAWEETFSRRAFHGLACVSAKEFAQQFRADASPERALPFARVG